MTTAYYQNRLRTALSLANAASDPSARIAHEGMARGYRAILAAPSVVEDAALESASCARAGGSAQYDGGAAIEAWANEGGAGSRGPS